MGGGTQAYGINDAGAIVGVYMDANSVWHGFSLSGVGGTYTSIDYPGASVTQVNGINNTGTIVGEYGGQDVLAIGGYGFTLSGTTYSSPMDYPGALMTYALAINDAGTVVGYYIDAAGDHGFMATPGAVQPSLAVTLSGAGSGVVTSAPSGIDCSAATCNASFASGTALVLSGTAESGSCFIGWVPSSSLCSGYLGTPCDLTLTGNTSLGATFQPTGIDFCDVPPGYLYQTYIDALFTSGITTGCVQNASPIDRRYCPSEDVPRNQMAAFIIKALQIAAGQPAGGFTYPTTPYFTDVPSTDPYFSYIQRLKYLGITATSGAYSPDELVTRDQMAAFLVRATQVKAGQGPEAFTCNGGVAGASVSCATTTPYFTDVPSVGADQFFPYIQKLKELGITTGCGNGDYCPSEDVARDQMAAFIARAFLGLH